MYIQISANSEETLEQVRGLPKIFNCRIPVSPDIQNTQQNLYRNKSIDIQEKVDSCLKKAGYEHMK